AEDGIRDFHVTGVQTCALPILVTLIVGTLVHVDHANRRTDAALRLSHDEVRRLAALAERERIGRDLHDLLGHTLSLVALKSDLRSEERRVGKERRSRWATHPET